MTPALVFALLWGLAANVLAMLPSRDNHWQRAYALMAAGVPILLAVFWQNGLWVGLAILAAGLSVLRWPVRYLIRWIRAQLGARG